MKAIILLHEDGTRNFAFLAKPDFDTQAWAQERRKSLELLTVICVIEECVA